MENISKPGSALPRKRAASPVRGDSLSDLELERIRIEQQLLRRGVRDEFGYRAALVELELLLRHPPGKQAR